MQERHFRKVVRRRWRIEGTVPSMSEGAGQGSSYEVFPWRQSAAVICTGSIFNPAVLCFTNCALLPEASERRRLFSEVQQIKILLFWPSAIINKRLNEILSCIGISITACT